MPRFRRTEHFQTPAGSDAIVVSATGLGENAIPPGPFIPGLNGTA